MSYCWGRRPDISTVLQVFNELKLNGLGDYNEQVGFVKNPTATAEQLNVYSVAHSEYMQSYYLTPKLTQYGLTDCQKTKLEALAAQTYPFYS